MRIDVGCEVLILEQATDGGLITHFGGGIFETRQWLNRHLRDEEDDPDDELKLGSFCASRLHVELCHEAHADLAYTCDAESQIWLEVWECYLTSNGYKRAEILADCCVQDVFLIEDIGLKRDFRGRGIELAVARRLIDTVGAGCGLAVYYVGDRDWEAPIYAPLGFKPTKLKYGNGLLHLNLTRTYPMVRGIAHPTDELMFELYDAHDPGRPPLSPIVRTKPPKLELEPLPKDDQGEPNAGASE
ncbi:MAG: hypothetical protein PHX83_14475 [Acidobacteriia bacterium]|nr:hypothetical protein [Terriglobia bacterium]